MNRSQRSTSAEEPMISPRQAAELLPLPRYRLSELIAWASQRAIPTGENA